MAFNNRPHTSVSIEPDSLVPLQPIDFVYPSKYLRRVKPRILLAWNDPQKFSRNMEKIIDCLNVLLKRQNKEYLLILQERSCCSHSGHRLHSIEQPKVGDVLVLKENFCHEICRRLEKQSKFKITSSKRQISATKSKNLLSNSQQTPFLKFGFFGIFYSFPNFSTYFTYYL